MTWHGNLNDKVSYVFRCIRFWIIAHSKYCFKIEATKCENCPALTMEHFSIRRWTTGPMVRHEWNFASNVLNNLFVRNTTSHPLAVWPDWAIYWTLGEFLNTLATINLSKSPTFLGNFCKHVEIFHFTREIIFGQLLQTFGDFYWSHCPLGH